MVAEGVETEMQAIILRQLGCHVFQGFLYAMPMTLDDFMAFAAVDPGPGGSAAGGRWGEARLAVGTTCIVRRNCRGRSRGPEGPRRPS